MRFLSAPGRAPALHSMNTHFLNKRLARILGIAGLLPFVVLSLACWLVHPDWLGVCIRAQIGYGIAILSFLGGIHWGAALASEHFTVEQTKKALIWGVMPAALAWFARSLEMGFGFAVLMLGFVAAYQVDKRLYQWYRMPDWFLMLRFQLTCVVVVALAMTFIAANVRA